LQHPVRTVGLRAEIISITYRTGNMAIFLNYDFGWNTHSCNSCYD